MLEQAVRSVGLAEEKWIDIFRSKQPNREEWLLPFSIAFPNPLYT